MNLAHSFLTLTWTIIVLTFWPKGRTPDSDLLLQNEHSKKYLLIYINMYIYIYGKAVFLAASVQVEKQPGIIPLSGSHDRMG